eukprot:COSAG06_NODE_1_length_58652_cov_31.600967_11_plen_3079_part_00
MVANGDDIARPDPYAVLRLKGPKGARPQRSSALVKTVQPAFDQRFQFFVPGEQLVSLGMQLWSSEEGQSDQFLGSAQLNICHLFQDHWEAQASGSEPYTAEMVETEIALEDPDKKVKVVDGATEGEYGRAFVSVEFAPNPEEEAIPAEPEAQGSAEAHLQDTDDLPPPPEDPRSVASSTPAPVPATHQPAAIDHELPKYLSLIANEAARIFWFEYIGEKRAELDDFVDLVEAWLLKADVDGDTCSDVLDILRNAYSGQTHMSYSDFNKLTRDMSPFEPDKLCEVVQSTEFQTSHGLLAPQRQPNSEDAVGEPTQPTGAQSHAERKAALKSDLDAMKTTALRKRAIAENMDPEVLDEALDSDEPKQALVELLLRHVLKSESKQLYRAQEIRSELEAMKTTELRKAAIAEGVDSDMLDDALDSDTPKLALVEVLLQHRVATETQSVHKEQTVRTELQSMKTTELRKRAVAEGVDGGLLDDALDSDTPKDALVELLLQHLLAEDVKHTHQEQELRSEFQGMRTTELRKRAVAEGVAADVLDDALDSDTPKDALIEALLQHLRNKALLPSSDDSQSQSEDEVDLPPPPADPPPAPAPATHDAPKFLSLISNEGARQFWADYMVDMRVPLGQLVNAIDAWLLQGGVSEDDRAAAIAVSEKQLSVDDQNYVSYGEFNRFTLEMTPWIPPRVCEVILKHGVPLQSIDASEASSESESDTEVDVLPPPPPPAEPEPEGPRWLELIVNPGAREFWQRYIGEKKCETSDVTDALKSWLSAACNITRQELGIIMEIVRSIIDADDNGWVTYGEFNDFTLEMMPFKPERVREVLGRSMRAHLEKNGPGPDSDIAVESDQAEPESEPEAKPLPDLPELDLPFGADPTFEPEPDREPEPGPEPEPEPEPEEEEEEVVVVLPRVAAHIIPGSVWWKKAINQAKVERRSQIYHQEFAVVDAKKLHSKAPSLRGLKSMSNRAEVLKLLREMEIKDRQAQLITNTFVNRADKADLLQVAGSLVFLCKQPLSETADVVFQLFADGKLLQRERYARWVTSITKLAKSCASGSYTIFNALCGGDFEPSKQQKQADFNQVVMNAAKSHVQGMEKQLLTRFNSNVVNAGGMKRKRFIEWLPSLQAIYRWLLGLSEEWRNTVDTGRALCVPNTKLPLSIRQLKIHFESPARERRMSQLRMTECLGKMGINEKSMVLRITRLYDLDSTNKYALKRHVLTGLSLLCRNGTGELIELAMIENDVDMSKENVKSEAIYAALRPYTATVLNVSVSQLANCSLFDNDKKMQDTLARILNFRVGLYMNHVSVMIAGFVQKMSSTDVDYADLGRMLDQQVGLQKWRDTVGKMMAKELHMLSFDDAPVSPAASTIKSSVGTTALVAASDSSYSSADIRCVQPGSFWNRMMVFSGSQMPRQDKRGLCPAFDTLDGPIAHAILDHGEVTEHLLDQLLHKVDVKSHSIAEDLFHLMTTFTHDQTVCLACAVVLLCKLDMKGKFAVTYELLTNTKPQNHKVGRRLVWRDIEIWMESMVHVTEEVVTHVTHRLHEVCSGERRERNKRDEDDHLLQQILKSMKAFAEASCTKLRQDFEKEAGKLARATDIVQQQRFGTGDGMNQKEFVRWIGSKQGVCGTIEAWLNSLGNIWVVQLTEFEECFKSGVTKPTSVQRLSAAGLSPGQKGCPEWTKLSPDKIHAEFGISPELLVVDDESGDVIPQPKWLQSDEAVISSLNLISKLLQLGFSQVSAERVALLLDTEGLGRTRLREVLSLLYLMTGSSPEQLVDRNLRLYEIGVNPDIPMPDRIFHFLQPYMIVALDSAEGMSTLISALYGKDYAAKHGMLEYAHDHVCEYADHVGASLAAFIRQRGTKNYASSLTIRMFLDETLGFSQWSTDIANEWIMHCESFARLKEGVSIRSELAKFMDYKNQFETVCPSSFWWKRIVQNSRYHDVFGSSHSNWDSEMQDIRVTQPHFSVDLIWKLQADSVDHFVSTAEADEITKASGILQMLPGVTNVLHSTFMSGGRNAGVGWAEFSTGCLLIGGDSPQVKFQRVLGFLAGPANSASIPAESVQAVGKALVKISLFNTRNLNETVQRLCGYQHEPEWVSKHEQYQTMTLSATEKSTTARVDQIMSGLLGSAQGGALPVKSVLSWAQQSTQFQQVLKTSVVWMQHSLLVRCTIAPEVATLMGVAVKLQQFKVDYIKPIIDKYITKSRAGPKFMMEMCKALQINSEMRDHLSTLLADGHDGTVDVREAGVICSLFCGGSDARTKFAYAAELYDLANMQSEADPTKLSFMMASYSMCQAYWKVAVHVMSSFITAYEYAIEGSKQLFSMMIKTGTIRLGVYMDRFIREFQKTNLADSSWQDALDGAVGHTNWIRSISVAFADTVAGILTSTLPLSAQVTPQQPTGLPQHQFMPGGSVAPQQPMGLPQQFMPGGSVTPQQPMGLLQQQFVPAGGGDFMTAGGSVQPPRPTPLQIDNPAGASVPSEKATVEPEPAPQPEPPPEPEVQEIKTKKQKSAESKSEKKNGKDKKSKSKSKSKGKGTGTYTPAMEPVFEIGARLQKKSEKGKWRWYTLRTVEGEGMCICKYKDEKAAEADKDLSKIPKSRLPLFAVTKVARLKSDATEFVKVQGQTNRFRIEHSVKGAMETDELRGDESADIMPFLSALEHWAPLKTTNLEVPKSTKEQEKDVPLKWAKRYVVLMRFQIMSFDDADASSMKPSQVFIITDATRLRVIPQAVMAAEQPWLTLGNDKKQDYRDIEFIELAYDIGEGPQRKMVLKGNRQRLQGFVDILHDTAQVSEGDPPEPSDEESSEADKPPESELASLDEPDAGEPDPEPEPEPELQSQPQYQAYSQQQGMIQAQQPGMMQGQQPGMMQGQPGMMPTQQPGMMQGQQPGMMQGQPGMMPTQQTGMMQGQTGMVQGQQPGMMQGHTGMVQGQQPGMMPAQQPGMMQGQQPGMMQGQQPGMMQGQQPGMMQGQQGMMQGQQPGMMPAQQPGMMQAQQQGMMQAQQQGLMQGQQPGMMPAQQPGMAPGQTGMMQGQQQGMIQGQTGMMQAQQPQTLTMEQMQAMQMQQQQQQMLAMQQQQMQQGNDPGSV